MTDNTVDESLNLKLGQIIKIDGNEGKLVSSLDLEETILCTPALSEKALFVRSDNHLWKLAN